MLTVGEVDSEGHLELREDPEAWIKNNPSSRLALVTSLDLHLSLRDDVDSVELPANIGQLVSLTHLKIDHCENIESLLMSIANLSKLTFLSLSGYDSLVELPANIGQLVSLTHLKIDHYENIESLPMSIANLSKLTFLSLSHCDFLVELPANIGQLVSLTHLELEYCQNIKSLPMSIANLSNLTFLSLTGCESLFELPANIGQLVSLTHLKIDYCESIESLPMSIANLSKLTSLTLESCDSLVELPANIWQLVSLSRLELYGCDNIKSLPDSMKDLCSLDTLFIESCYNIKSLTQLPIKLNVLHLELRDGSSNFRSTGLINLKYSRVTVCSCSDESFANWKDPLQRLSISGCFRHDNNIIINLNQFVNLQVLSLHDFIRLVELPANLDGLAHLCLLDIQPSDIKCLPWSITKLRKLQHLMLPKDFRLETLPYELNNSVTISVQGRHVRKSWEELKTERGELRIPCGGEIGNDAAQNPSIMSPGYLRLEEDDDPSQWITNNRNLLMLVRILDLDVGLSKKPLCTMSGILQFSELTHLYLYINYYFRFLDNYFSKFTRLTHLSLNFSLVKFHESVNLRSICKLSNLQTLHLYSLKNESSENFNMPVSLKHLSLTDCNMRPLYDSLEKLTNLRSLDLNSCYDCESLPPCMCIHKLRLVGCSFKSLDSLPSGLHHLEILFFKDDLRCIFEKCWNKLVDLETLSITCFKMEFFPEDIVRLHNLQKLQLKDCISLKILPSNLHELVNLHTLDISVTGIKILPPSFVKPRNLQHLILPKCFKNKRLPSSLEQVSTIDDTKEAYYKTNDYDASLYQASASDESKDEESCNEDDCLVPTVEIHETVPDEQTSADLFNSISIGSIEHSTTEQGGISQIYKDLCYNKGENSNPSGESSHAIQNTITTETEQGIAKEIDCGGINHHALESEQNHIPQSNNVRVKMKRNNITLEMLQSFWSNHTKLVDAAEELGVTRSTLKRRIKELGVERWPRKGKKQQPDAKKRKHNNKAPFESDCSQQNLVNLGSSAAHAENVECIMGSDLHTLPNHVSSNSNVVIRGNLMETIDSHQGAEVHLNGANERTLSDTLPQNEKSSNFIVKAYYNDDIVRFDFSLSKSIDQLKEEIANKLELEVNTFKIKYKDEEKEKVTVTDISDLEHALNLSRSSNNSSVVRLFIFPKT